MAMKNNSSNDSSNPFGEVIYSYTRSQAIEDGVLVEAPKEMVKEAGIKFHVAITATVWHKYVDPSEKMKDMGQSLEGRLWDVLFVFRTFAARCQAGQNEILFPVIFLMPGGYEGYHQEEVILKAHIGPGDSGEPVITIMGKNED